MSNEALTWAFATDLKPGPKFVLIVLADMADSEASCYPGIATIARKTGYSETAVKDNLRRLKDAGLITDERRNRKDGSRTSNRYWLAVDGVVDVTPERLETESGPRSKSRIPTPLEPESAPPTAGIRPPVNPQIEPSEEPSDLNLRARDEAFEAAWKSWPRGERKKPAREKFGRLVRDKVMDANALGAEITAAAAEFARAGVEPRFTPHLVTWLNQERWNDEKVATVDAPTSRDALREWARQRDQGNADD